MRRQVEYFSASFWEQEGGVGGSGRDSTFFCLPKKKKKNRWFCYTFFYFYFILLYFPNCVGHVRAGGIQFRVNQSWKKKEEGRKEERKEAQQQQQQQQNQQRCCCCWWLLLLLLVVLNSPPPPHKHTKSLYHRTFLPWGANHDFLCLLIEFFSSFITVKLVVYVKFLPFLLLFSPWRVGRKTASGEEVVQNAHAIL